MNKKIFYAFISLILMSLINCKTYAQNTGSASIDGYAVEVYNDNIIDEEDDETSPIQDIPYFDTFSINKFFECLEIKANFFVKFFLVFC